MAVIGVYSAKGGVGKTTIAVDLAWRSAVQSRHRTLLWDLDPQGGSAFLLAKELRQSARAASVFQRDGRPRDLIEDTAYDRLSLLQADESLRSLNMALARIGHKRRLAQLATGLSVEFDRIVLDCPPMINEVSEQVLHAADVLIVPLPASPLAMRTLDSVRRELARSHIRHAPILPVLSKYNAARPLHREVRNLAAQGWPIVPMAMQVEQMAVRRAPLGAFASGCKADMALGKLWRAIEAKLAEKARSDRQLEPA